ncbi:MAG: hypothetical protein H6654_10490 [Ardenticatenaceae bacterium]|nr:hypothetical protein [Anaerolineales bacterium]MCB8938739.1 hypothetical protein [Ardenticatenaceae bacterium]MCB8973975.1 hypothetical protein [Ardenticatenaceae bacterium]
MARRAISLGTFTWFAIALGYVCSYQLLGVGGYEWALFRNAAFNGGLAARVANPPYIFALFYPLFLLPLRVGIFIYSLIGIGAVFATHRLTGLNKWLLLLSFPIVQNLFSAQLDTLSMLGVALGWWAIQQKRPYHLGLALVLLGIKPHVTGILIIAYLVWGWHPAALLAPTLALLYSFAFYGFWIPGWLESAVGQSSGSAAFFNGGLGAFPYGLLLWLPILLGRQLYSRLQLANAVTAATMLSMPYVGSYSVQAFLGLPLSWVSYLFMLPVYMVLDVRPLLILIVLYPLAHFFVDRSTT